MIKSSQQHFLSTVRHIDTKIGTIAVLSFKEDIPEGWERLQLEEAQPYLEKMK